MVVLTLGLMAALLAVPLPFPDARGGSAAAQAVERYEGRLAVMPVDFQTARTTSGSGRVVGTVEEGRLRVEGTFEGTHTPVTGAEIRRARPGRRGGAAVTTIQVTGDTSGRVVGSVELTDDLRRALRKGHLHVVIRTEGNPEGELRGWLLPRDWPDLRGVSGDGGEAG